MRKSATRSERTLGAPLAVTGLMLVMLTMACGRGAQRVERTGDTAASVGAPPAAQAPAVQDEAGGSAPTDPQVIALGKSVFEGRTGGGTCFTCHGQDAKGTQLGPNLADPQWLQGDGSYNFIVNTVMSGVPTPKQYPGMMPPMGGASLTSEHVKAVAAYVYSLRSGS